MGLQKVGRREGTHEREKGRGRERKNNCSNFYCVFPLIPLPLVAICPVPNFSFGIDLNIHLFHEGTVKYF